MKLAVAVLSSILLACSITIANPIDPSATTDVESIAFPDLPSATTDVESSIFPDLPSATTDVESSIFPDLPSATTDVESSIFPDLPSATTDVESSIFPDLPSATTDVESSIFPDLPSATTDVESSIFPDLPSATTDVESSIFPDLPSATTDVETSTSTVIPSATTSTEASTLPTPNPNGIGLGGLDPLPDSIKELLEKYEKKKQSRDEQKKKCELLRFQYDDQKKHATDLKIRLYLLEHISQGNGDGPKYDDEIQVNESNFEAQESKLNDLKKRLKGCDSKYNGIVFGLKLIEVKLVTLVFGGPWDPKSFDQQLLLIGTYPSIQGYFGGSGNKGQSSGRSKRPSQKPSDQQSQESQPSPDTPSGSGSPGQKVPSNRQKGSSKFMNGLKSFFGRPK